MYKKLLLLPLIFGFNACANENKKLDEFLKQQKENMVFVKGGSFMMGDPFGTEDVQDKYGYNILKTPENEKKYPNARWLPITFGMDNKPSHKVTLDDFYISKYEVTWEEYDRYSEVSGREYIDKKFIGKKWRSGKYPVDAPSWYAAKQYCEYLAEKSGLNYDLPTEAQWEYAARSKGKYVYFATDTGRGIKNRSRMKIANELQNMADKKSLVGSFPPNPLGLYDMTGNFPEWVNDWYDKNYYKKSPKSNPKGPLIGEEKVVRGGHTGDYLASITFNRFSAPANIRFAGFRCVINP